MTRPHYGLTFAVLTLAGLVYTVLTSLVAPALRSLALDLHTTATAATWLLTAPFLSAAVATPIIGRIGDMFGKKRVLVLTLAVMALGTLVSAVASSLPAMLAGRVIQGFGGGVFPVSFAIIRDEFPRERAATSTGILSSLFGVGAGLGVVITGPILDHLSYHWLFWIPFAGTVVAMLAALPLVPESPIRTPGHVDWLGAAGLAAWLVALLLAISQAPAWGWGSGRVAGLLAAAAALAAIWIVVERRSRAPLVDLPLMRRRTVWTTNAAAALVSFGTFAMFVVVPQFVETPAATGYGFSASVTQAGLYLVPLSLTILVFGDIAGRLDRRTGSRLPLVLGAAVAAAAFVLMGLAHDQPYQIYLGTALAGAGIGLAFAAMINLLEKAVPSDQTGIATGINAIMRSVGGAFGTTLTAVILAGSAGASGLPSQSGFTLAFLISAIGLGVAALVSLAVPRSQRQQRRKQQQSPSRPAPDPTATSARTQDGGI